ncbi:MAG: hypothetical protein WBG67_14070, partial [Thermoanaerobaculia bacterium]
IERDRDRRCQVTVVADGLGIEPVRDQSLMQILGGEASSLGSRGMGPAGEPSQVFLDSTGRQ